MSRLKVEYIVYCLLGLTDENESRVIIRNAVLGERDESSRESIVGVE